MHGVGGRERETSETIVLPKKVDVFEIHEVNPNSEFYDAIMKDKLFVG